MYVCVCVQALISPQGSVDRQGLPSRSLTVAASARGAPRVQTSMRADAAAAAPGPSSDLRRDGPLAVAAESLTELDSPSRRDAPGGGDDDVGVTPVAREQIFVKQKSEKRHAREYPSAGTVFSEPPSDDGAAAARRARLSDLTTGSVHEARSHEDTTARDSSAPVEDDLDQLLGCRCPLVVPWAANGLSGADAWWNAPSSGTIAPFPALDDAAGAPDGSAAVTSPGAVRLRTFTRQLTHCALDVPLDDFDADVMAVRDRCDRPLLALTMIALRAVISPTFGNASRAHASAVGDPEPERSNASVEAFVLAAPAVFAFLDVIDAGYARANPYHNALHAANVVWCVASVR